MCVESQSGRPWESGLLCALVRWSSARARQSSSYSSSPLSISPLRNLFGRLSVRWTWALCPRLWSREMSVDGYNVCLTVWGRDLYGFVRSLSDITSHACCFTHLSFPHESLEYLFIFCLTLNQRPLQCKSTGSIQTSKGSEGSLKWSLVYTHLLSVLWWDEWNRRNKARIKAVSVLSARMERIKRCTTRVAM